MALAPLVVPKYPNVPNEPGVPPLVRALNKATAVVVEVEEDVVRLRRAFLGPQWGLFDSSGRLALQADSVKSFEFMREWNVSNYPVENGGFQSYNKVEIPYDVKLTFMIGGSVTARISFLRDVDGVCQSTDLFTATTPEAFYIDINPRHYDYRREARAGANMLVVDLWCTKIRQSAVGTVGNGTLVRTAQQPAGAVQQNTGNVQPVDADLDLSGTG